MSFQTELLDALGTATDTFDTKITLRNCFLYDFTDGPLRVWDGEGVLYADGEEWIGTMFRGRDGVSLANLHQTPEFRDPRDQASPEFEFGLPYLSKADFQALQADQTKAEGREVTRYKVIVKEGEGLRPGTALEFADKFVVQSVRFFEGLDGLPGESIRMRRASVVCRSVEIGRSLAPRGTYTDLSQQERARVLGENPDSGCAYVASNARRTFEVV